MVSVHDVAKHCGLSTATVSRALNGSFSVKKSTRDRVLQSAKVLGYVPNTFAQSLRHGKGKSIALVTGDVRHGIYAALAKHVQFELEGLGFDTLLYDLDHSQVRLQRLLERARSMGLRGILLASADTFDMEKLQEYFQTASNHGIVLASVAQRLDAYGITSIVHDNMKGARDAVLHLHQQGYGQIAFMSRISTSGTGRERYEGYIEGLISIGKKVDTSLILETFDGYRSDAGYRATLEALDRGVSFSGLITASDDMALGALAALRERGLSVPGDVAVVGFGGFEWVKYIDPPLTSLALDIDSMAYSIRCLFDPDTDMTEPFPLLTLIPPVLEVRCSS